MFECIGFSEIDKHAEAIYRHHWPDVRNFGDATKIVCDDLPDFDFLIAGFPCQAFSIAGKRQGFNDARGTMFFEIARILSHKRPAHFLLENVGGLASDDKGKTQQRILEILASLDYFVERPLLNSKDYGVPQNRERVFFVGHSGACRGGEILSIGNGDGEIVPARPVGPVFGTISTKNQSGQCNFDGSTALILSKDGKPKNKNHASCLSGGAHSGGNHSDMDLITVGTLRTHKDGEDFREMQSGVAPALNGRARQDGSQQGVVLTKVIDGKQGQRVYDGGGIAATIKRTDGGGVSNERYLIDNRIRRFTPLECERLQGLPDFWTVFGNYDGEVKEVSDTQRYKTTGNAMTVNVIEGLIRRMREVGCLG